MCSYSEKRRSSQLVSQTSRRLTVIQDVGDRHQPQKCRCAVNGGRPVGAVARKPRAYQQVCSARARQHGPRRRYEVVEHSARVVPERNPRHRVGNVFVKAREKTKAVLAGQQVASLDRAVRHWNAARLAAEEGPAFVYADIEAALRKLMGRAQPADTSAQNRHRLRHSTCRKEGQRLIGSSS